MNLVRETALVLTLVIGIVSALVIGSNALAEDSIGATIYGKANVSIANFRDRTESTWELSSNASRLGFKGASHLGGSLEAIYKLEFEVFFDDGDSGGNVFKQRNIYVGLQGRAGTLFLAKHDSALKMAQLKVDRFNDLPAGDIKSVLIGENRLSNIINYTTPRFGGLSATVQLVLNEGDDIFGNGTEADGLTDSISSALNWRNEHFNLALAYDKDVVSKGRAAGQTEIPFDSVRLTGQAVFETFELGAIYEQSKDGWKGVGHRQQTTDGYVISGALKSGNWKVYAQLSQSDMPIKYEVTDENRQVAIGLDFALARSTKLFAYYSKLKWEDDLTTADQKDRVLALGFEHKF
jgi:predicted porin|tara:strand:- start:1274 stop:2323 length:1050 start_codon:yes stop_codon:yes gene_type:complete